MFSFIGVIVALCVALDIFFNKSKILKRMWKAIWTKSQS